jgi:hypothetical protein
MALGALRGRTKVVAATVAAVTAAGIGTAVAETTGSSAAPPSNRVSKGMGIDEFGMTSAYIKGQVARFTYTKGFFCDTEVRSKASSGCEAGKTFKKAPAKRFDPLYITVPLGFKRPAMSMDCPTGLVCVDHPGTIDLSRLEPALKPLYPGVSNKKLRKELQNAPVPGHDHFITTKNGDKPEWWDVKVVGVTKKKVYDRIVNHRSYSYIHTLQSNGNKHVTASIPTNLFLYFGVK